MGQQILYGKPVPVEVNLHREEWIGTWQALVIYPDKTAKIITECNPKNKDGDMRWPELENHCKETGGKIHQVVFTHENGSKYYTLPGMVKYEVTMTLVSDSKITIKTDNKDKSFYSKIDKASEKRYRNITTYIQIAKDGGEDILMKKQTYIDKDGNIFEEISLG